MLVTAANYFRLSSNQYRLRCFSTVRGLVSCNQNSLADEGKTLRACLNAARRVYPNIEVKPAVVRFVSG